MTKYRVKSEDRKKFSFTNNTNLIGELTYQQRYTLKADILLANGSRYQMAPKEGDSATTIELKDNENVLLTFKMNSKGSISINTKFDNVEQYYTFKYKEGTYVLLDIEEVKELLLIETDFKWNKFDQDYNISTTDKFDKFESSEILLLSMIHCINYYQYLS